MGEFVEGLYTTSENEPLPLRKQSTMFPQLQNIPHLVAFLQKVTEEMNHLEFPIVQVDNLTLEQLIAFKGSEPNQYNRD